MDANSYLDYCSEALAVIGKVAALYVQRFKTPFCSTPWTAWRI